jgi:hypothetical protein
MYISYSLFFILIHSNILQLKEKICLLSWVEKMSQFCPGSHRTRELNSITTTTTILLGLILHYCRSHQSILQNLSHNDTYGMEEPEIFHNSKSDIDN